MPANFKLLRIYTDELAFTGDRKSVEIITTRARRDALAGVTVLEAMLGFGSSAHIHRRHALESDRSIVLEIVDEDERLRAFARSLTDISGIGLMTLEEVEVVFRAEPGEEHRP